MKAVIIAAGCGSRLIDKHQGMPKSLLEISGRRIIDDIISKTSQCGINNIIIVTGFKNHLLESGLDNYKGADVKIDFVHNVDWRKANGISIFSAKEKISPHEEFILLMSDHIFDKQMLQDIVDTKINPDQALSAIDFKINQIPDLDDGMKVQCIRKNDHIFEISQFGKKLTEYSAIDTGMFKMNYNFFDMLETAIHSGKDALSDACNALAKNGKMLGMDIGEYLWLDIDTPEIIDQRETLNKIFLRTSIWLVPGLP